MNEPIKIEVVHVHELPNMLISIIGDVLTEEPCCSGTITTRTPFDVRIATHTLEKLIIFTKGYSE